jgi:ATP-dependent DNA ligase
MTECITIQKPKQYHFLKIEPAEPSILSRQDLIFGRKWAGNSSETFIDGDIEIIGRGVTKGRNSNYTLKFPELINDLKAIQLPRGTNFLSEIICIDRKTGKEDEGLVTGRSNRESLIDLYATQYPALMLIYDVISIGVNDVTHLPYTERINALRPFIHKGLRIGFTEYHKDGKALWEQVVKNGWEGVVIRDPKNSNVWKLKQELTEDVFCTGEYEMSTSDTNMNLEYEVNGVKKKGVFKNLTCYQLQNGRQVRVCDVGTGISQYYRTHIQIMLDEGKITKENPLVLEVKANERHDSGKLKHPSFKRIRTDKPFNQCVIKGME